MASILAAGKALTKVKGILPGRNGSYNVNDSQRGILPRPSRRDTSPSGFSNRTTSTRLSTSSNGSSRSSGSHFSELPFGRGGNDSPTPLRPTIRSSGYASTRDYHSMRRSEGNWVGGTSRVYSPRNSVSESSPTSTYSSDETTPKTVEAGFRIGPSNRRTSNATTTTVPQTSNRNQRNDRINQLFRTSASTQTDASSSTGVDKNGLAAIGLKGAGLTAAATAHGATSFLATKYQTDKKMEVFNRATSYMEKHGIPWVPGGASNMPATVQHTGGHNGVVSPHGVNPYTYANVGEMSNAYGVGTF